MVSLQGSLGIGVKPGQAGHQEKKIPVCCKSKLKLLSQRFFAHGSFKGAYVHPQGWSSGFEYPAKLPVTNFLHLHGHSEGHGHQGHQGQAPSAGHGHGPSSQEFGHGHNPSKLKVVKNENEGSYNKPKYPKPVSHSSHIPSGQGPLVIGGNGNPYHQAPEHDHDGHTDGHHDHESLPEYHHNSDNDHHPFSFDSNGLEPEHHDHEGNTHSLQPEDFFNGKFPNRNPPPIPRPKGVSQSQSSPYSTGNDHSTDHYPAYPAEDSFGHGHGPQDDHEDNSIYSGFSSFPGSHSQSQYPKGPESQFTHIINYHHPYKGPLRASTKTPKIPSKLIGRNGYTQSSSAIKKFLPMPPHAGLEPMIPITEQSEWMPVTGLGPKGKGKNFKVYEYGENEVIVMSGKGTEGTVRANVFTKDGKKLLRTIEVKDVEGSEALLKRADLDLKVADKPTDKPKEESNNDNDKVKGKNDKSETTSDTIALNALLEAIKSLKEKSEALTPEVKNPKKTS